MKRSGLMLILAMLIWGTVGIVRKAIPLDSSFLAMLRGLSGALFLLIFSRISGIRPDREGIRKNLPILILSGAIMGFNWILLFEAYRYTTVSVSTLCYYMAPILVLLFSPLLLNEALNGRKWLCIAIAFIGIVFVSGVIGDRSGGSQSAKGVFFGLGAAVLYAGVMILNQKMHGLGAYDKTIIQLAAAGIVLIPYVLFSHALPQQSLSLKEVLLTAVICILHTGVAYALYFGSMDALSGQTVALYSFIDPISALILSAVFLREPMSLLQIIGAILILGAAILSER